MYNEFDSLLGSFYGEDPEKTASVLDDAGEGQSELVHRPSSTSRGKTRQTHLHGEDLEKLQIYLGEPKSEEEGGKRRSRKARRRRSSHVVRKLPNKNEDDQRSSTEVLVRKKKITLS